MRGGRFPERAARCLSLLLHSPAQDGKHIKCFPLRAELATNLIAPPGRRAAETRSVQSNIVQTEFWLIFVRLVELVDGAYLYPFVSCGEIVLGSSGKTVY